MAECSCGNKEITLIYACSGAANTGFLADQVARNLMNDCCGKMTCLAAIGAELPGFMESAKSAKQNILIDGCPVACGKKIFEKLSLPYKQYMTTDFGVEKGKTKITESVIKKVSAAIKESIQHG